jgi:hypothetical protein
MNAGESYTFVRKAKDNTRFTQLTLSRKQQSLSIKAVLTAGAIENETRDKICIEENDNTATVKISEVTAATGDAGEFFTVDLGDKATINAIQLNWDHIGAQRAGGRGGFGGGMMGGARTQQAQAERLYQCYEVFVSDDNSNWTKIISKPQNKMELKHDYNELENPVQARYVKVVNVATYDNAKFSIKDLRVFGTTPNMKTQKVTKFMAVRNPEDRREANVIWEPVAGADGYVIRYGIEKKKLYNSYIVYGKNDLYMHSLNTSPEYYFEVEAFTSGLPKYTENPRETIGLGAELQIAQRGGGGNAGYAQGAGTRYIMLKENVNEYWFDDITAGTWTLSHSYGPVLWSGQLSEGDVISNDANPKPTVTAKLTLLGEGTRNTGTLEMEVIPGKEKARIRIVVK